MSGASFVGQKAGEGYQFVRAKVGPPAEPPLPDGDDACYADQLAFDKATHAVAMADYKVKAATVGAVGLTVVAFVAQSNAAQAAALGGAVLLGSLAVALKEDRSLAIDVTRTLDELNRCRSREVRALRAQSRTGELKKDEAEERLRALRTKTRNQAKRARDANEVLKERNDTYKQANEKQKTLPPAAAAPAGQKPAEPPPKPEEIEAALRTNQRVLDTQAASIAEAEKLDQSIEFETSGLEPAGTPGRVRLASPALLVLGAGRAGA